MAESMADISGPLFITFSGRDSVMALSADEDKGVYMSHLDAKELPAAEPESVAQVFYILRLPVSAHGETSYSIKTGTNTRVKSNSIVADDRYLSCDKFGCVTGDKVAVGPYEEWIPVERPDGFALLSAASRKFLQACPDDANVRCDAEDLNSKCVWLVKCQAQDKKRRKLEEKEKMQQERVLTIDPRVAEAEQMYQLFSIMIDNL